MTEHTSAQILAAMSEALRERDVPAVVGLLHMLAVADPASAEIIYAAMVDPDFVEAMRVFEAAEAMDRDEAGAS